MCCAATCAATTGGAGTCAEPVVPFAAAGLGLERTRAGRAPAAGRGARALGRSSSLRLATKPRTTLTMVRATASAALSKYSITLLSGVPLVGMLDLLSPVEPVNYAEHEPKHVVGSARASLE